MRERRGRGGRSAGALRAGRLVVVMGVLVDWWIGASSLLLPTLARLLLRVRAVRMTDARPREAGTGVRRCGGAAASAG
ncbi:hypothetical protein DZF93_14555, partial [Clavibacter michiganensis subsp. insidiosus]